MSTSSSLVLLSVDAAKHTGTLTLNRPSRGNALTADMMVALVDGLATLQRHPAVRVVLITGHGKYFCTGMDLSAKNQQQVRIDSRSSSDAKDGVATQKALQFFRSIQTCQKPVVAVINGPVMGGACRSRAPLALATVFLSRCFGGLVRPRCSLFSAPLTLLDCRCLCCARFIFNVGGNGIVFACDFRVCSTNAYFWFSEVKRGLVPAIISAFIVHELGPFKAKQLLLSGKRASPSVLLEYGALTAVVKPENLCSTTVEMCARCLVTRSTQRRRLSLMFWSALFAL